MSLRINAVKRRTGRSVGRVLGIALALVALLPMIAASPAAAAANDQQDLRRPGIEERPNAAPTSIIALAVRVTDLDTRTTRNYKIAPPPAEQIPLEVGDRVRVELTGTAIVNGNGVAVDVPARFEIASGDWRIDMAPAADNAVVVSVQSPNEDHRHGNPDSRSSLAFTVTGNFDLKPAMRNGRITFDIAPTGAAAGSSAHPNDARWNRAEEIAQALSSIRLDRRPIETTFVERIYNQGTSGIRDVASLLANEVARSGDQQLWQRDDLLARLYRNLLGRQGDTRQIAAADPDGFSNNLRLLDREGYEKLVLSLVSSPEFRQVHDLDSFDDLPANPDVQRRPMLRDTRPNG